MKQIFAIFFILISIGVSSQQVIRGYSASYAYGLLSVGDDFTIKLDGSEYTASARDGIGSSLHFGFPFDYGVNRHRICVTPGLDILTAKYKLDVDPDIGTYGTNSDSLVLNTFMLTPQVGLMYKYHFYVGPLHLALGVGIDVKLPVSKDISLDTKDKTTIINYEETDYSDISADKLLFKDNTIYSNIVDLGLHISPKIGLDIHVTRFLVTNIYYYTSPLTNYTDKPAISGFGGFGATYLIPFGKEDDSRLLQYYKN